MTEYVCSSIWHQVHLLPLQPRKILQYNTQSFPMTEYVCSSIWPGVFCYRSSTEGTEHSSEKSKKAAAAAVALSSSTRNNKLVVTSSARQHPEGTSPACPSSHQAKLVGTKDKGKQGSDKINRIQSNKDVFEVRRVELPRQENYISEDEMQYTTSYTASTRSSRLQADAVAAGGACSRAGAAATGASFSQLHQGKKLNDKELAANKILKQEKILNGASGGPLQNGQQQREVVAQSNLIYSTTTTRSRGKTDPAISCLTTTNKATSSSTVKVRERISSTTTAPTHTTSCSQGTSTTSVAAAGSAAASSKHKSLTSSPCPSRRSRAGTTGETGSVSAKKGVAAGGSSGGEVANGVNDPVPVVTAIASNRSTTTSRGARTKSASGAVGVVGSSDVVPAPGERKEEAAACSPSQGEEVFDVKRGPTASTSADTKVPGEAGAGVAPQQHPSTSFASGAADKNATAILATTVQELDDQLARLKKEEALLLRSCLSRGLPKLQEVSATRLEQSRHERERLKQRRETLTGEPASPGGGYNYNSKKNHDHPSTPVKNTTKTSSKDSQEQVLHLNGGQSGQYPQPKSPQTVVHSRTKRAEQNFESCSVSSSSQPTAQKYNNHPYQTNQERLVARHHANVAQQSQRSTGTTSEHNTARKLLPFGHEPVAVTPTSNRGGANKQANYINNRAAGTTAAHESSSATFANQAQQLLSGACLELQSAARAVAGTSHSQHSPSATTSSRNGVNKTPTNNSSNCATTPPGHHLSTSTRTPTNGSRNYFPSSSLAQQAHPKTTPSTTSKSLRTNRLMFPPINPQSDKNVAKPPLFPVLNAETLGKRKVTDLKPGTKNDYCLKCTSGAFRGRYLYPSPEGELFGGDAENPHLTMLIENAGLANVHARIETGSAGGAGSSAGVVGGAVVSGSEQEGGSSSSTSGRPQLFLEAEQGDTWTAVRWNRSLPLQPGQDVEFTSPNLTLRLKVQEGEVVDDEILEWLRLYSSEASREAVNPSCKSLEDLRDKTPEQVITGDPEKITAGIRTGLEELGRQFPPNVPYPKTRLKIVDEASGKEYANVGWSGGHVLLENPNSPAKSLDTSQLDLSSGRGSLSPSQRRIGSKSLMAAAIEQMNGIRVASSELERSEAFRICYCSNGKWYCHFEQECNTGSKHWLRLLPGQKHNLQPGDVFRIGELEFAVLRYNYGTACDKGFRASMEDAELVEQDLCVSSHRLCSMFSIYDGHCKRDCVDFIRARLHLDLAYNLQQNIDETEDVHSLVGRAIWDSCLAVDEAFRQVTRPNLGYDLRGPDPGPKEETDAEREVREMNPAGGNQMNQPASSGCAAVFAVLLGTSLYVACIGDSRAVLARSGTAYELSWDQRPERDDERERILARGGFVSFNRVLGRLAVSRAFGDYEYKFLNLKEVSGPLVIAEPEVRYCELEEEKDEFLVLACDGLWDVIRSQEAVDFVHEKLAEQRAAASGSSMKETSPTQEHQVSANNADATTSPMSAIGTAEPVMIDPDAIAKALVYEAIHVRKSRDNVSCVVVLLQKEYKPKPATSPASSEGMVPAAGGAAEDTSGLPEGVEAVD
ncbi:unnamed protein product [Amoebophrya sp. A120]|nr:unnamed protein product [Amoebophrya sp. A120]|eukprot:GSA120T00012097001.1